MAERATTEMENQIPLLEEKDTDDCEPVKKKTKLGNISGEKDFKLEDRLNGILCCAVCLDLPNVAVYQCLNGHLMCAACLSHLLADARLKDESSTCPNCRCEISKSACSRNLAVEKAISELPADCVYCSQQLPRCALEHHQREICSERLVMCKYDRIGCPWRGPHHELQKHQEECPHPCKTGEEIMGALQVIEEKQEDKGKLYSNIFNLLSFEKITFNDLQLRPYRTDDFITKLFYETSRFSAFNMQWVLKARINDNHKNPEKCSDRKLTYQLVLKSRVQNPISVKYLALRGPYGEVPVQPVIFEFEFSNDTAEGPYYDLPLYNNIDCNKIISAKTISLRLILFQMQK